MMPRLEGIAMGEEILTRVNREWLSLASINNQGGFDMPTDRHGRTDPQGQSATRTGEFLSTARSRLHSHGFGAAMTCVAVLQKPGLLELLMLWQIVACVRQGGRAIS